MIDVYDPPVTHYIAETSEKSRQQSLNFDHGGMDGLTVNKDATDISVRDGRLDFKVGNDIELVWGDLNSEEAETRGRFLGKDWGKQAWPWMVQLKIRQSSEKSKWYLQAEYLQHGHRKKVKSEVVVTGRKDQVVQFNMGTAKGEYFGFRLVSTTANNDVSIDWIKAVRPSIKKVFRYKFNIQENPIANTFVFSASGETSVFINGAKLGTHGARHPYGRMLNVYTDVSGINRGMNELCVTVEGYNSNSRLHKPGGKYFFLEGVVIDETGSMIEVKTGNNWRASYSDEGCTAPGEDFRPAKDIGTVKRVWPVMKAILPHERFGERPYLGRLRLEYGSGDKPVFSEREDALIKFNVLAPSAFSKDDEFVNYQLKTWSDDKRTVGKILKEGAISRPDGIIDLKKLKSGVYELILTLVKNGEIIDERRQELVVAGKIHQNIVAGVNYTQGMQLKKTDYIKFDQLIKRKVLCAQRNGQGAEYLHADDDITSAVKNLRDGHLADNMLELPAQRSAWCSVKFNTGQLYKPHLVEIEYPDGDSRSMLFVVAEDSRFPNLRNIGNGGGIARLTTGVFTEEKSTTRTAIKRFIYWPNKNDATLTIINTGRSYINRGAISSLTVYEIENDLPAFTIPLQDKKDVFVGPFVERVDRTTPRLFYGGELEAKFAHNLMMRSYFSGYYNAWYTTISNLIKYMRFSGQNTYYAGIYMYSGGWFSSDKFQGHAKAGVDYFGAGWSNGALELMARMFEENGLKLVLGMQFIGSRGLTRDDAVSDTEVAKGVESIRMIDKNGKQVHGFQGQGYNFLSTKVSDEIYHLANEIGSKFSQYEAVKGITWMRQPEFPLAPINSPGRTPVDIGYGDLTISLYKQQTDTLLPASPDYQKRFKYRYKWLMQHEKEKWIQWRNRKIYESDKQIEKILLAYRSDWKLWRIVPRPVPELIKRWGAGELNAVDVYRYTGIDPELYAQPDQLDLMLINNVNAEKKYELRQQTLPLSKYASGFYDSLGEDDTLKRHSMFIHTGFVLETQLLAGKKWPWQHLNVVGYSMPSTGGLYSRLSQFASKWDNKAIAIGWSDVGHFSGYEQDVRDYWREMGIH